MRRPHPAQGCLNATACAGMAALTLAVAHQPRLSIAAAAIAVVALILFLLFSVRSARR